MRILKLLLALAATTGLIWFLQRPIALGDKTIPAIGKFLNPFTGFWKNAEPVTGLPFPSDPTTIPGLSGKVEVVYDDLMVPHVFAENMEDAYRVQGFVTASNRLWQMDIATRKASGRLSEVLGEKTLLVDRMARRRGMLTAAETDLRAWKRSPSMMKLLDAYTEGVNAYVSQLKPADYPIEFKLLGYEPQPWSPLKIAMMAESMAETLCSGETDLAATNALALYGRDTFNYLYPEWNPKQDPVIPDEGQWKDIKPNLEKPKGKTEERLTSALPDKEHLYSGIGDPADYEIEPYLKGSNNWAVSGVKTRSKHPILANDPHLNLTLPSIWFQIQLHTPDMNVYGVSLPGLPGVAIGFNDYSAWGMTNVGHDVADWYRLQWVDKQRTQYLYDGQARNVDFHYDTILIKGKPALIDTIRYTSWGPVVYDFDPKHELFDCAYHWLTQDEPDPNELLSFFTLNANKGYDDYRKVIVTYDCPAQNFIYATRSGDIAIQVQGRYPVREKEQGRFVQDGSSSDNQWHGYIPADQVPTMKNPSRGFVFSANQHSTPPSYPYYYLGDFEDYRGRHIYDRLTAMTDVTVDSIKQMQSDNYSLRAAEALPAMLKLLDRSKLDADGKNILDKLSAWDFRYDKNKDAPPYYDVWYDSLYMQTWDEMFAVKKANKAVLFPEAWRFIDFLQHDTLNVFFDNHNTPARETARDIVTQSFLSMEKYFTLNPQQRVSWGNFRGFAIKHLAQIDAFSRLDVVVGGQKSTINAMSKTNGPSWRMVVDLGDTLRAWGAYPGGQSGNPGSPFYDNMVNTWAEGNYYDLLLLSSPDTNQARIKGKRTFVGK